MKRLRKLFIVLAIFGFGIGSVPARAQFVVSDPGSLAATIMQIGQDLLFGQEGNLTQIAALGMQVEELKKAGVDTEKMMKIIEDLKNTVEVGKDIIEVANSTQRFRNTFNHYRDYFSSIGTTEAILLLQQFESLNKVYSDVKDNISEGYKTSLRQLKSMKSQGMSMVEVSQFVEELKNRYVSSMLALERSVIQCGNKLYLKYERDSYASADRKARGGMLIF